MSHASGIIRQPEIDTKPGCRKVYNKSLKNVFKIIGAILFRRYNLTTDSAKDNTKLFIT